MNGYNFTERVRKALAMSREEAARLNHEYVGTEHILLGLLREGEGVAATVLKNLSVEASELELRIDQIVKKGRPGERAGPDLPYTSRAKKVLELAMSEARELNHAYVGTEHLLLGLLREEKGIGAQVLNDSGVNLDNTRAETLRILGTTMPAQKQAPNADWIGGGQPEKPGPKLTDRMREVMHEAEQVATEFRATHLEPIHLALALVRHGDGIANAVMDRIGCKRSELLAALEARAKAGGETIPAASLGISQQMLALQRHALSQARGHISGPTTTLNTLLALLDTDEDIAKIFERSGITANHVRAEARKISG
jgi:ATP-dependent Clp protease ATP-binding subunit ClpA